jgi:hypothetical protein
LDVAAKYDALERALKASIPQTVTRTFAELDELVGGLPPSARADRTWWGNTTNLGHTQARAWMGAGYRVERVELGMTVTFIAAGGDGIGPRSGAGRRVRSVLDGVEQLSTLLTRAGYRSVVAAVAEHTIFLHPDTVAQTGGAALFRTIRDMLRRGQFDTAADGRRVLLDDNTSPTRAFLWAAGMSKGRDVQFNHVWNDSRDPDAYTALWNLCATPAFLAKTTDGTNYPEVTAALRYHAYRLYGARRAGQPEPSEPAGYELLRWPPHPDPVTDLEVVLRARLRANAKSRPAVACREIGWLFSGWEPDLTL